MSEITGGLRKRLIRANLYNMLHDSLDQLDWFASGRKHAPITFNSDPVNPQETVPYNTLAIADSNEMNTDWELGSNQSEHRWSFYLDFFAESDALGLHMAGDLKDILEGRFSSIGRTSNICDVYDLSMATPPYLFTVQIENVMRDRATSWTLVHQKHWYALRFDILDYYGSEDD